MEYLKNYYENHDERGWGMDSFLDAPKTELCLDAVVNIKGVN